MTPTGHRTAALNVLGRGSCALRPRIPSARCPDFVDLFPRLSKDESPLVADARTDAEAERDMGADAFALDDPIVGPTMTLVTARIAGTVREARAGTPHGLRL
jgi:hypothetical protein